MAFRSAYGQEIYEKQEITGLAAVVDHEGNSLIATANMSGKIDIWAMDSAYSVRLKATHTLATGEGPISLTFTNDGRMLRAYSLYDGSA